MQKITTVASPLLLALISVGFGQVALAQDANPSSTPSQAFMMELDADGDGRVTLEEARVPQEQEFDQMDQDDNGMVTAAEAGAAFAAQVPPEMLEALKERGMIDPGTNFVENLDENSDGMIDADEFGRPTETSFAAMDADGDGGATADEAAAYFDQLRARMQEQMQMMQEMMGGQN